MDFILRRMIADVDAWYDQYYQAVPVALEQCKRLHITVLTWLYDPARFSGCDDLETERAAFLGETQQVVDKIRGII